MRLNIAVARVTESGLPLIYVNQVGGQDELVFDGASFGLHADCSLAFQLPAFRESVTTVRWQRAGNGWRCLEGPHRPSRRRATQDDYCRLRAGPARLCRQERLHGRGARASPAASIPRCARRMAVDALGAEARALRDAALSLHLAGIARRCRRDRRARSASPTTWCRSRARSPGSSRRWRRCSPAGRATSPRRTCRRARAAPS